MNKSMLVKLIKGELPTRQEIEQELYDICDRVHASCGVECPAYVVGLRCMCFKNGRAMFNLIKEFNVLP